MDPDLVGQFSGGARALRRDVVDDRLVDALLARACLAVRLLARVHAAVTAGADVGGHVGPLAAALRPATTLLW